MNMYNKLVITNVDGFLASDYNIRVESLYDDISGLTEWVEKTTKDLLARRTNAEKKFAEILKQTDYEFVEQPYFRIDDKGYFLDFLLPDLNIAFELNGGIHQGKDPKYYDMKRDECFRSIGINTIRLANDDINVPNVKEKVLEWIESAKNGNPDPTLYYKRSDRFKFRHEDTLFRKIHKQLISYLENCKDGESILLMTNQTYFCKVFIPERATWQDYSNLVNGDLVSEALCVTNQKNLFFRVVFIGSLEKVWHVEAKELSESYNSAIEHHYDHVLRTEASSIVECDDVDHTKYRVAVTKDRRVLTDCPHGMYSIVPIGKKKYKSQKVGIGNVLCFFCEFNRGKEDGYVSCVGNGFKGTREIYGHLTDVRCRNEKDRERYDELMQIKNSEYFAKMKEEFRKQRKEYFDRKK